MVSLNVPKMTVGQMGYHPKGHVHSLNAKALKDGDDIEGYQHAVKDMVLELGDIPTASTK